MYKNNILTKLLSIWCVLLLSIFVLPLTSQKTNADDPLPDFVIDDFVAFYCDFDEVGNADVLIGGNSSNIGELDGYDIPVRIYLDDNLIYQGIIDSLAIGEYQWVCKYEFSLNSGIHDVTIDLNYDHGIEESNYDNNILNDEFDFPESNPQSTSNFWNKIGEARTKNADQHTTYLGPHNGYAITPGPFFDEGEPAILTVVGNVYIIEFYYWDDRSIHDEYRIKITKRDTQYYTENSHVKVVRENEYMPRWQLDKQFFVSHNKPHVTKFMLIHQITQGIVVDVEYTESLYACGYV